MTMGSESGSETRHNDIGGAMDGGEVRDVEMPPRKRVKLHGRAFYESIGSPKLVLAPMVEQSEFAWRMLTRSFLPASSQSNLLAYTPMFHSKMFIDAQKYRDSHFQPLKGVLPSPAPPADAPEQLDPSSSELHLDGNPAFDRPLTVQFCSNDPDDFLAAAKYVAPFCDAVDLNLGCPQGIARRGNYGAFLQEDQPLISRMIRKLHEELDVPVTAKMRILETKEKTLDYARTLLEAGASIITVHGRRREQKGHNTGLADWTVIRYLRDNLPPDTVIFANGNILQHDDIARCLEETGADAVMSAEGNLHDPTIFAEPPKEGEEGREYWRGRDGKGGYRVDAVMRRYMDIVYKYALGIEPPARNPLFVPADLRNPPQTSSSSQTPEEESPSEPPRKKHKPDEPTPNPATPPKESRHTKSKADRKQQKITNPNLTPMQAHLFHLLRPLVAQHHNVRDALAKCRVGDIAGFERVLQLVEDAVKAGLIAHENENENNSANAVQGNGNSVNANSEIEAEVLEEELDPHTSSLAAVKRCKRPWWVCQAYVRPVPKEAFEKGSLSVGKKEIRRMAEEAAKRGEGVGDGEKEGKNGEGVAEMEKEVLKEEVEMESEIPKQGVGVGVVCG